MAGNFKMENCMEKAKGAAGENVGDVRAIGLEQNRK
jgi:hypothetical protein